MHPLSWIQEEHQFAGAWAETLLEVLQLKQANGRGARVESLEVFWRDRIAPHMAFEEEHLFPVVLEVCPAPEVAKLVDELLEEHKGLRADFNRLLRQATAPPGSSEDEAALFELTQRTIGSLLDHARREDSELVPQVEGHLEAIRLRFRERQDAVQEDPAR